MQAARNTLPRALLLIGIAAAFLAALVIEPRPIYSQSGTAITGWLWSDTAGWVSLNCSDSGTCGTVNYGLSIASDGAISGYAWSDNVGWISANAADLTGCPSAPCTARMDELSMEGWLKAVAGGGAQSGGWDGFISLSGANYGPTLADGAFTGYAWGDMNLGWISFDAAAAPAETSWLPACATTYACTDDTHRQSACRGAEVEECSTGLICSAGACTIPPAPSTSAGNELTVNPRLIGYHDTATVSWSVDDATSCTVSEDNPSISDSWTGASGSHTTSPITDQTTYTLACTGPGGDLTQTATIYRRPDWKEL